MLAAAVVNPAITGAEMKSNRNPSLKNARAEATAPYKKVAVFAANIAPTPLLDAWNVSCEVRSDRTAVGPTVMSLLVPKIG